jgi:hypothetical protein
MAGTPDKKQTVTAALAGVRIQLQNDMLLLRSKLMLDATSWSRSGIMRGSTTHKQRNFLHSCRN